MSTLQELQERGLNELVLDRMLSPRWVSGTHQGAEVSANTVSNMACDHAEAVMREVVEALPLQAKILEHDALLDATRAFDPQKVASAILTMAAAINREGGAS